MEHTIGDLGQEIQLPSNPFANLAQHALRQSQVNALKSMFPELDPTVAPHLPRFARDLSDGHVLLRPWDKYVVSAAEHAGDALRHSINTSKVRQWGRLHLPNGQVARSLWCESKRSNNRVRVTRNVKVHAMFSKI